MIKTYPDQAAFDAAEKSKMESTVGLLENTGKVVLNGVNVITDQPKVGDIACYDENRKIVFIQCDTYQGGTFPSAWETVGVVVIRKGNKVTVLSKNISGTKWIDVYPYVVTGYQLDGAEHAATLKLHGSETKTLTYTASTDEEFLSDLKNFLTDNAFSDWSAYIMDGKVILQYDNYTSPEYLNANVTQATGIVLTPKIAELEAEAAPEPLRKNGTNGKGVWHAGRAKMTLKADTTNVGYNPPTNVTSMPSYAVCWPAFAGTSEYQEDHCLWLRQKYCKDPNHPTIEEWEKYIDENAHVNPTMLAGNGHAYRSGKPNTGILKSVKYQAADGTEKALFPWASYCSEFIDGKGYLPSIAEYEEIFGNVTYGLTGVTRENADPINRSLYAIGADPFNCNYSIWTSSFLSSNYTAWNLGAGGELEASYMYYSVKIYPLADIDLSEINE